MNPTEPNQALAPVEPERVLVHVDQAQLMAIVQQRNQYHEHVCRVIAALPILLAELPKINWLGILGQFGFSGLSATALLSNPFSKKKKKATESAISNEQLLTAFAGIIQDHPHLKQPVTDLITFWNTYKDINNGVNTEQQTH